MQRGIGRTGALIVVLVFLRLAAEDILIWVNSGVIPGTESSLAALLVVGLFVVAILQARSHRLFRQQETPRDW